MGTVRMNITLPEELSRQLDEMVHPGRKSRFIAEAVSERIHEIKNEKLASLLKEGYSATRKESLSLSREFEAVDLEGWDEY